MTPNADLAAPLVAHRFSARRMLRDDLAVYGAAVFLALFALGVWPLWSRLVGWSCALVLLWMRPRLAPYRVWSHALERGGSERMRRRTGLRASLAATDDPIGSARILATSYLGQRLAGAPARAALTLALSGLLLLCVLALLASGNPMADLASWSKLRWRAAILTGSPVRHHLLAQLFVACWLIGLAMLYRHERFQLEHPPTTRWADLRALLAMQASHLMQGSAASLVWFAGGFLSISIGYYLTILIVVSLGGDLPFYLRAEWLPLRPLVEFLWLPVAGLGAWALRELGHLRLTAERQSLFAVSILSRQRHGARIRLPSRYRPPPQGDRIPAGTPA